MATLDGITVMDDLPPGGADEEAGFGCLDTVRGGLPLRRLAVGGRITGLVYRLEVAQTFVNACAEPLEATYIFPLPARAGVTQFRLRVGERVIEGVLKERGAAREEYDRALRQGNRAAIAEEERPEVFTVRAGNLPPGEAVMVELELAGPLAVADGEATFRFPLVVAPRYIPGVPLDGPGVGLGTAPDTDAVPDASRITPPVLLPGQPNPVHLAFRLELDPAGLPLSNLRASLHALRLDRTAEGLRVIELAPGAERLDRDIILRFRVGEEDIGGGLSVYRNPDGETTILLTVTPPATLPATVRPRDVVVLLDRSGSMGGWKMVAARRAAARLIDTLTERDRFGLILFDDRLEEPAPSAGRLVAATDRVRFRAVEFLARVEARDGTEIAPALTRALGYFPPTPEPDRERILLFITDGQVGNEDPLLRQVHQQARDCRIFAVGIDRAVNASLLERLAGYGGGHCALVESEDRLDDVLRAVHRRLGAPLLTDVRLEPALEERAPDTVDLFPGVPLRLGGRWSGPAPAQVVVTGRAPDGQIFRQTLIPVETADSAVHALGAGAGAGSGAPVRRRRRSQCRAGGRDCGLLAALWGAVPLYRLRGGGPVRGGQPRRRIAPGGAAGGIAGRLGHAGAGQRADVAAPVRAPKGEGGRRPGLSGYAGFSAPRSPLWSVALCVAGRGRGSARSAATDCPAVAATGAHPALVGAAGRVVEHAGADPRRADRRDAQGAGQARSPRRSGRSAGEGRTGTHRPAGERASGRGAQAAARLVAPGPGTAGATGGPALARILVAVTGDWPVASGESSRPAGRGFLRMARSCRTISLGK
jgi:hypothetical protein